MKFSAKAVNDSFKRLNEAINKDNTFNKRLTEAKMSWKKVKDSIKQSLDDGIDPFYEETDAAMYVETIMQKVEEQEDIFLEPSIQAGRGGIFFYHGDKQTGEQDYQEFNQTIAEMVLDCSGPKEFSSYYSNMLDDYHDYSDDDYYDDDDYEVDSPDYAFYDKAGRLLDKDGNSIKDRSNIREITIADDVTFIAARAFEDCNNLTSIKIPDTVTSIGDYAFWKCDSLTSISIPTSVTSIGEGAFRYCKSLISIEIPSGVTSIEEEAFAYCYFLQSINIPNSVTSIGYEAFSGCSSLTSIKIPDSVTSIGDYAFISCINLTSIDISNSVTNIRRGAFYNCFRLTSISIPNGVTSIENYAFAYCNALTNINIPNSVMSIGENAFVPCSNLKTVYLENPNTKYEENSFPEDTKIIKKGTDESMKIRKNESINLKKAKRLLENNGYEVVKKNNLNEILSESDFIDPMRVIISIKPKEDDDYHMQQAMDFFNKNIYTWKLGPEVLVDNSDGTYQLCFPGVDDWMNKIKLHCEESILNIQVKSLI